MKSCLSALVQCAEGIAYVLINQIMSAAFNYELDGVNIDFENITEDAYGDSYIEFIRELGERRKYNSYKGEVGEMAPNLLERHAIGLP